MSDKLERDVLEGIIKLLDKPSAESKRSTALGWAMTIALWLGCALTFFLVFRYGGAMGWPHLLLASASFAIGLGLAYEIYKHITEAQWPTMAKYIDREKLERRLAELRA